MRRRHPVLTICIVVFALLAAAYLRDPPWLLTTTSGMRGWELDQAGNKLRWMGGHASFFVPADARSLEIPLRTAFDQPGDWPVTVRVSIDDRTADQLVLSDSQWHRLVLLMPPRGSRRVRRVDIRADRTRDDNRGAALGEVQVR